MVMVWGVVTPWYVARTQSCVSTRMTGCLWTKYRRAKNITVRTNHFTNPKTQQKQKPYH